MILGDLIRPNLLDLVPYSSARGEFGSKADIWLDANENPDGKWNRYPDPLQKNLKIVLAERKGISSNNIFIGNGSDEAIDLLFRLFCRPGKDKAFEFVPTYGMYGVSAKINDVEMISLGMDENFQPQVEELNPYLKDETSKILFLCSPNNPTGNLLDRKKVESLIENFPGIVVVDEAYIDFAISESWSAQLERFPNLIILQTFSKALGLAGARVGMAFASEEIIKWFNKIKPPYNVSDLSQKVALQRLLDPETDNLAEILTERNRLQRELMKLPFLVKQYPSEANFVLIEVKDGPALYDDLVSAGIVIRKRDQISKNTLRITIGNHGENSKLIESLKTFEK
jgi:histidinol-phosphate aminotransferase